MKLGSTFLVPADPSTVFERFLDAGTMRASIPGCEELVREDETHYSGRLVNQVAHVRFSAAFGLEIVEMDLPREISAVLKGEDSRLASSLNVDAKLQVEPDGDQSSKVTYSMDLALRGKLGRMGESIFRHRTAEVEKEFVARFSAACSSPATTEADLSQSLPPQSGQVVATSPLAPEHPRPPWWRRMLTWLRDVGGRG